MSNPFSLDYLADPRDKAILSATPTLMMPLFGPLPPVDMHRQRFVIAEDGVYLQARTPALDLCIRVSTTPQPYPYGSLGEWVCLPLGPLPYALYEEMRDRAVSVCPREWAGVVTYDPAKGYILHEPSIESASASHIRYSTTEYADEYRVLDIHSHGRLDAFHSRDDDKSDRQGGVFLSTVLGHCDSPETVISTTRLVVNGRFFRVAWSPWEPCAGISVS